MKHPPALHSTDAMVGGSGQGSPKVVFLNFFGSQGSSFSPDPPKSPVHQRSPVTSHKACTHLGEEIFSKSSDSLVTIRVISTAQEDEEILAAEISEKEEEEKEEK